MGVDGVAKRLKIPRHFGWAMTRARDSLRDEGPLGLGRRTMAYVQRRGIDAPRAMPLRMPRDAIRPGRWPASVLMIAAPDPLQCYRYRVGQKAEACAELGIPFVVVDPADHLEALSQVQLAGLLIVFRQAESRTTAAVVAEARRLGVPVVFEADDLVYRRDLVAANPNLSTVPPDLRKSVINGADGYRRGLELADHVLASTDLLATDMDRHVSGRSFVMQNGIDANMQQIAQGILADPLPPPREGIVITYGSGSRAHDLDLGVAAPGLAAVMSARRDVRIRLIGPLRVPPELAGFSERIERIDPLPYGEYLRTLANSDITIAPLADHRFNEFKSQVKYLEAGLVRVPFVASPVLYRRYVRAGETGLLPDSDEWGDAILQLIRDPALAAELASAAHEDVQQYLVPRRPTREFARMLQALEVAA